jgi:hypothetical protein
MHYRHRHCQCHKSIPRRRVVLPHADHAPPGTRTSRICLGALSNILCGYTRGSSHQGTPRGMRCRTCRTVSNPSTQQPRWALCRSAGCLTRPCSCHGGSPSATACHHSTRDEIQANCDATMEGNTHMNVSLVSSPTSVGIDPARMFQRSSLRSASPPACPPPISAPPILTSSPAKRAHATVSCAVHPCHSGSPD